MKAAWLTIGLLCGCAAGKGEGSPTQTTTSDGAGGSAQTTTAGTGGVGIGSGGSEPGVPGCEDGADDLFLLGFDLTKPVLYEFDPPTLTVTELGPLTGCPAGTGFSGRNPWAAALDRQATIWAHYLEWDTNSMQFIYDRVHTIDPATGQCTDTGASLTHPGGKVVEYGLAFVRDPSDPDADILYASAMNTPVFNGTELATVSLPSMALNTVGPLTDTYHSFLTSTGDGRLFTLFRNPDIGLRELDPTTAQSMSDQPITGLNSSQGPFAFWGGAIWAFWMKTYEANELVTDVYRIDMTTWQAVKVTSLDFIVTAATVSTCAPLEVPK